MIHFGSCCACGATGRRVRNLILLERRAPVPFTGWGCLVCGLESSGATAVVCDECLASKKPLKEAIKGSVEQKQRIAIDGWPNEKFEHDLSKHQEDASRWFSRFWAFVGLAVVWLLTVGMLYLGKTYGPLVARFMEEIGK